VSEQSGFANAGVPEQEHFAEPDRHCAIGMPQKKQFGASEFCDEKGFSERRLTGV
jgi:hypothetical protein